MAITETRLAADDTRPTPVATPLERPDTPLASPHTLSEHPAAKMATPDTPLEQAKMRLDKESARAEPDPASLETNLNWMERVHGVLARELSLFLNHGKKFFQEFRLVVILSVFHS